MTSINFTCILWLAIRLLYFSLKAQKTQHLPSGPQGKVDDVTAGNCWSFSLFIMETGSENHVCFRYSLNDIIAEWCENFWSFLINGGRVNVCWWLSFEKKLPQQIFQFCRWISCEFTFYVQFTLPIWNFTKHVNIHIWVYIKYVSHVSYSMVR